VDEMLVELAGSARAMIVTTDSGLRRVAEIRAIPVLFLADLSQALKPVLSPGDTVSLRLTRKGEQPGQGVGYLEDGTMVVAEDGGDAVGEVVTLVVGSSMNTSAGRLFFGRLSRPAPREQSAQAVEKGSVEQVPAERATPDEVPAAAGSAQVVQEVAAPASGNDGSGVESADGSAAASDMAAKVADAAPGEDNSRDNRGDNRGDSVGDSVGDGGGVRRGPGPPAAPKTIRAGTPRNPRRMP
jgi:hypothetical protein